MNGFPCAALVFFAFVSGCGEFPSLGGGGGDAGAAASRGGASGGTSGDAGVQGVDCITEPQTGATLCTGISSCPGVAVDHDLYPHCGFRPGGAVLDLECACQTSLCPVGVAKTCDDAKKLLGNQSETTVCAQVAEDRCTGGGVPATSGTSTPSTCDKQCASECGGAPGCIHMCGC